jgi:hypothetical protein
MQNEKEGHCPGPPAMFMNCSIETPSSNGIGRPSLRSLGWFLSVEQLLQIYPFSLSFRQESGAGLRTKISYDDTII